MFVIKIECINDNYNCLSLYHFYTRPSTVNFTKRTLRWPLWSPLGNTRGEQWSVWKKETDDCPCISCTRCMFAVCWWAPNRANQSFLHTKSTLNLKLFCGTY